jgi:hypothetical protein
MKKLNSLNLGKGLNRAEMKSISGGLLNLGTCNDGDVFCKCAGPNGGSMNCGYCDSNCGIR